MNVEGPPRLARALLLRIVPEPHGSDLAVELDDAFAVRAENVGGFARVAAVTWYWRQVLSANSLRLRNLARGLRVASQSSWSAPGAPRPPTRLSDLFDDLRYGLRSLAKAPAFTLAAVLTLGVGIGAVTSIYSTVGAMLVHPVPFRDLDTLVLVGDVNPRVGVVDGEARTHPAEFGQVRQLNVFDGVVGFAPWFTIMTAPGEPIDVVGYRVSSEFFDVLGVAPLHGRAFAPWLDSQEPEQSVVLGHAFWQRRFGGDPAVLDQSLQIDGRTMRVAGVLPPGAAYPPGTDLYSPLHLSPDDLGSFGRPSLVAIGRLADGVSLTQARAAAATVDERLAAAKPDNHVDLRLEIVPLMEIITYGSRALVGVLMAAAVFLLLLVCANVASLQLARASTRSAEIALRQAIGARRGRLIRQLLVESLCLSLFGAALGSLFAVWGSRFLRTGLIDPSLRFYFSGVSGIGVAPEVLAFAAVVAVAVSVVAGLVPALRGSRVDLSDLLKPASAGGGGATRGAGVRSALVVAQVVLATLLLTGTGYLGQSLGGLLRFDRGLDTNAFVVRVRLRGNVYAAPDARREFIREASEELRSLPGIQTLGISDRVPAVGGSRQLSLEREGVAADPESMPQVESHLVGREYFSSLAIPIHDGRAFDARDENEAAPVAVVGALLAARLWPGESPIGTRVRLEDSEWLTVVGVAGDTSRAWNAPDAGLAVYRPFTHAPPRTVNFVFGATDATALLPAARDRIWRVDSTLPIAEARSIAAAIAERARMYQVVTRMTSAFAAAAFLLAVAGIYSIVCYAAARRTWEMGIRVALGARPRDVMSMFVRQGLKLTIAGLILGIPASWLLTRALAALVRGRAELGGTLTVLAPLTILVLFASLLASYLPARRAAQADPAATLRSD